MRDSFWQPWPGMRMLVASGVADQLPSPMLNNLLNPFHYKPSLLQSNTGRTMTGGSEFNGFKTVLLLILEVYFDYTLTQYTV